MEDKKRLNVILDTEFYIGLKQIALNENRTVSNLIRTLAENYCLEHWGHLDNIRSGQESYKKETGREAINLCKNSHIADKNGKCNWKGCKYS